MTHTDKMTAYIASFIDELASLDVQDVVVSPGSRSTPLAILAADHPALNVHINIDNISILEQFGTKYGDSYPV